MISGIIFALIAVFAWGISVPIIQKGFERIENPTLTSTYNALMYSLFCGSILLTPILFILDTSNVTYINALYLGMSGIFMFAFGTAAYYFSISKYGGTSVPMSRIKPLIASVIAVFLLNETVGSLFWVGLILIIGGSIIIAFIHSRDEKDKGVSLSFLRFYIIALSPALFWSIGENIAKIGLDAVNPIVGSYIGLLFGTITLFIYLFLKGKILNIRDLQGKLFFSLHGVFSFAIGYPALYASIDAIGVARASALTSIWPLIGVILSLFIIEKLRRNVFRKKYIFYLLLLGSIMMVIGAMII